MGDPRQSEHVGTKTPHCRNAIGRRRGRRGTRFADRGRAHHHLHRFAGAFAHDPQHVQDFGRTAPHGHARFGARACGAFAEHLRRPCRRYGLPSDGIRDDRRLLGAGSHGSCARRAPLHATLPRPLHQLLRRIPYFARSEQDRRDRLRRNESDLRQKGSR